MKSKLIPLSLFLALLSALLACQFSPELPSTASESDPLPDDQLLIPPDTPIDPANDTPITMSADEQAIAVPVYSSPVIFEFEMFTPTSGWGVTQDHNHLLRTEDGGQIWLDVTPPGLDSLSPGSTSFGIRPCFLDENTAWFTPTTDGNGTLYHTMDGGITWIVTPVPFANARYDFLDLSVGYALVDLGAGAGSHYVALYRTIDSGVSWTLAFTHEPGESKSLREGGSKNGITFRGVDHGWIGGSIPMDDYFYLYTTEDGGQTWAQETDIELPSAFVGSMLEVWQPMFVDASTAYLPVRAYVPEGGLYLMIYRSSDYGQTWDYQGAVEDGRAVDFYSAGAGWLAAEVMLYQTLDGGVTWSAVSTPGIPTGEFFLNVDFVDGQHGWVLTTPDDDTWDPLFLYRTSNGGASWTQLLP